MTLFRFSLQLPHHLTGTSPTLQPGSLTGACPPEIIVSSPNHHQAVLSSNLLPEVLHGFRVTLQGILTNDKEDWSLHVQERVVYILKEVEGL